MPGRRMFRTLHSKMPSRNAPRNAWSEEVGNAMPVRLSIHSAAARRVAVFWSCTLGTAPLEGVECCILNGVGVLLSGGKFSCCAAQQAGAAGSESQLCQLKLAVGVPFEGLCCVHH